jgi:hypothetical protein
VARFVNRGFSLLVFVTALALAYYYIGQSGAALPPMVAAHFDAEGVANSFIKRDRYVHLMHIFALIVPSVIVCGTALIYSRANNFKIPNRDYWLAPERLPATRAFLVGHSIWFGVVLTAMLCYVHSLVVKANLASPPHLSNSAAIGGVFGFMLVTLGWAVMLVFKFRRTD